MRNLTLSLAAMAVALPVTLTFADAAEARQRYRAVGNDGYYTCRRSNGTTGLIIGAAAGALVGRAIDGGRSRAAGTIIGAGGGALLGRDIARKRRCR